MRARVLLLLALAVQGAQGQGRPDTLSNPLAGDPAAAAAGKRIFDSTCVACHGAAGAGTERAPALDSGQFKHGAEDFEIFQTIQKGVPGTQMPPFASLRAEELWQLVSYVRGLSRSSSAVASAPAGADASRGEQLFFGEGKCSACHEVNGRGMPLAPDLSEVGKQSLAAIQAALEHAQRNPFGPRARYAAIVSREGAQLEGLVKSEDSFSLVLQRFDGEYALLDRRRIRSITNLTPSFAPAKVVQSLSADQKADLLSYLSQLKQRASVVALDGAASDTGLSFARLRSAAREPQNWLTYWGSYRGEHFSALTQIDRRNVSTLQARWAMPMPGDSPLESTPLVVDGVMYVSGPPGDVYALDARSGLQLWKFHRRQEQVNPFQINPYNRGVAVLGRRVFVATLDNALIALDARSGRVLWEQHLADTLSGYTMTGAPLALDGKVIVGISGGEMGIRGFLAAYDAADGHFLWRFDTIPEPGRPGHETWAGDSWKTGSGATWLTGSYDPELNLLYWAVGNPGPDFDPEQRAGDNLYTCSVLALDPETGRLVWHYQFTPHDTHDWDATEDLILAELPSGGSSRKVMLHADRNGFFYTLDRATGQFISAVPFVRQSWNKGFDANGRPIVDPASIATQEGHPIQPGVGGTNFQAPSYDPARRVLYLSFIDAEGGASYRPAKYIPGQLFTGAHFTARPPSSNAPVQGVMALDAQSGRKLWTFPVSRRSLSAGVLATRGDVVFAGTAEGNLIALDARSGKALWHFQTGGEIMASPMSYAVDGTQFIAVAAGNTLYSFALPERR
ncbi:MAG TPA: PQQ-dependent dehydrogenase, methanol/ethanol family [Steroidobacteraceae bacterium]|nr:PQQ-dependent dehydrogenase, methanol/ethanol family [Steroidobacteraceae bacterium]